MRKDRGFIILAQNTDIDYLKCAEVLARSIKRVMPDESVTLVTDIDSMAISTERAEKYGTPYDVTYSVPFKKYDNDPFNVATDCQVYKMSPYEYTIKLEADMYIPADISWWFDVLKDRDLVISTTIRDYTNKISNNRFYRKVLDSNLLPNTYNAITYFKKSETAKRFYDVVTDIFMNWAEYRKVYSLSDNFVIATDEVYAIAAEIVGREITTMPTFKEMSMIHMKNQILGTSLDDWTNELTCEIYEDSLKLDTIPQLYPVHYHVKSFAYALSSELDNFINKGYVNG